MSKHTPGPWIYHAKLTASENHYGFRIRAARWTVSEVNPIDEDGKEGEANARLIAAAPMLLEALQAAREAAWPHLHIEAQKQIDAAIDKATGEA